MTHQSVICFYSKECQILLLIIFECIYNCPSVLLVVKFFLMDMNGTE